MGPTHDDAPHGPSLHVLSMVPSASQGLDCEPSDSACGVPLDTPVRLSFDRPLWPSTAVRQSISIFVSQAAAYSPFLSPEYDLLTRTVNFRMSGTLLPRVRYHVRLPIAQTASNSGFRAYDGASLEDGDALTNFSFLTSEETRAPVATAPFDEPTCAQVIPLLASTCASSCCHGANEPAMGLRLDSAEGVEETAVLRVAHQTDQGITLGANSVEPPRFGMGMRIIEPNAAYSSYLVYKLLVDERNSEPCSGECSFETLPGADECLALSAAEQERIAGWFVQGEPMPLNATSAHLFGCDDLPPRTHLDCGAMRAITRWINTGAKCP